MYAVLSYCWGKSRAFTTTEMTIEDRKRGFRIEDLPKTCRDAIIVATGLGLKIRKKTGKEKLDLYGVSATDRLPALAGLAAAMQRRIQSRYLCGLWEKGLERELLWTSAWDPHIIEHIDSGSASGLVLKHYYAPTWSWASAPGEIWFATMVLRPRFRMLWNIVDVQFTPTTSNIFGPGMGELTVEGIAIPLWAEDGYFAWRNSPAGGYLFCFCDSTEAWFPDQRYGYQGLESLTGRELVFILAGVLVKAPGTPKEVSTSCVGLVLEFVAEGKWRRLGVVEREGGYRDWEKERSETVVIV
ncbi:hypothetical protein K469DRAFT_753239 [Zopfia rhizophila CBS 207.26]|uniref:Heterokaryon incompatibility domain-containing protein n=1 Tax=Zopfia rhizophila CBS 207.26 TaxID=1314779 RepID=A0A6A6DM42_9PEZI|nr:hypothetical protein K469DRAFT_753239 [Zopfia rhizophila CBS 207.26]